MEPLRTVRFAVRFAAALSAWWLLAAIPLVVGLGIFIYRRQSRSVAAGHARGLTALRALTLALGVFLAFRPSLVRRDTATYPARLLVVLDDSASLSVVDPALPVEDALPLARKALGTLAGREAPVAGLRDDVLAVEHALIRFEQVARAADRADDAFWREADRVQQQVNRQLGIVAERAADLAAGPGESAALQDASARCRHLMASLGPLFSGQEPPSADFGLTMRAEVSGLADVLGGVQAALDTAALDAGDPAVKAAVDGVRRTPRLDLAYAWLKRNRDTLVSDIAELSAHMQPLSGGEPVLLEKIPPDPPPVSAIETDISGTLLRLVEEDNPFPLAGILLISDGRNLGSRPLADVSRAASRRSVPIYCAAVAGRDEPPDIAVRGLFHPPYAVTGKPLGIRVHLKVAQAKPGKVKLDLSGGSGSMTNETLDVGENDSLQRTLVYTPQSNGLHRLTVRAAGGENEVVPAANNAMDLSVRVRPEPVRVLFLDWRPRWESRFVLNILGRLDYLDVNAIVVLTQQEGILKRGVGKGFWPEDAGMLALYDLVILGDLPPAVLTAAEWQQLADYVEAGGSLAFLGNGVGDPLPPSFAEALLPVLPRTADTPLPAETAGLVLSPAGRRHPVTRSLRDVAQDDRASSTERRRNDTIGLLHSSDGHMLVSTRFVGKGKTLLIDSDRLWRILNSRALDAHAWMVAGMADWAVESRPPVEGAPSPDLCRYTTRESVQAWVAWTGATNPVIELRSADRVLQAPVARDSDAAALGSAVFEPAPAGEWTLSLRGGGSAPEPISVVDRNRELHDLSRDEACLNALAANSGGGVSELADAARLLNGVQARSRVEHRERIWRLWDSRWVLGWLIVMLTVEWVWRKLAGLV